ncbi:flagellin [Kordiimonas gwangyangensis]|uniref:flagellin n=1 Tax=Kordiimonas gwangyangensis TaxID=288022 RepID=UPI00035F0014|nr:flagellin [Kordiimonas gwangyangensis]
MAFSVNTNAGAFAALRNLDVTNALVDRTQSRINTGLKVASAKDDAASFAISQSLKADVAGFKAVRSSLDRAISENDVALAAAQAISDSLIEMREKAVAAKDSGLDAASRTALNKDFLALKEQITSIVQNAEFNGRNLLTGDASTAITDATGSTTISTTATQLTLSSLSLDTSDLVTIPGGSVTGTVVALAGVTISAGTDAEFRAALVNLQNDNGGNLGGETIDASTGVTSDVVTSGFASNEFQQGVAAALGITTAEINGTTVDGFAFAPNVDAGSQLHLVRNGASSYLTVGDPTAGIGDASSPAAAATTVTNLDAAIDTVNDVLSSLGATGNRLDIQRTFASGLSDTLEVGIGNIVDADLSREAANLQAFQTKQQLGLQALGIANQAPQSVLSLFR